MLNRLPKCREFTLDIKPIPDSSIFFNFNTLKIDEPFHTTTEKKMAILTSFNADRCEFDPYFTTSIESYPLSIDRCENFPIYSHLLFTRNNSHYLDKLCSIPIYLTLDSIPIISKIDNFFLRHDKKANFDALKNAQYISTLFSTFLEGKDFETHDHNIRVGNMNYFFSKLFHEYVTQNKIEHEITEALLLNPNYFEMINYGGVLHDIGKLYIPQNILLKPSELTSLEYSLVKEHTNYGKILLDNIPSVEYGKTISAFHHEKWDGSGYRGCRGKNIPLSARITSFTDIFDAMTSKRAYKKAYSYNELHDFFYSNKSDNKGGFEGYFDPIILEFARLHWEDISNYHCNLKKRTELIHSNSLQIVL